MSVFAPNECSIVWQLASAQLGHCAVAHSTGLIDFLSVRLSPQNHLQRTDKVSVCSGRVLSIELSEHQAEYSLVRDSEPSQST